MRIVDLVIKNSKLVIPKIGIVSAGIAVDGGSVVAISSEAHLPKADRTIDAKGNCVLPGAIDPHVHYGLYQPYELDTKTETQSAAVGGVTTIMRYYRVEKPYFEVFDNERKILEKNALIDFAFHLGMMINQHLEELHDYVKRLGVTSFKFYLAYKGAYTEYARKMGITGIDDGFLYLGFKRIASLGPPARACLHCENIEVINQLKEQMIKTGRTDLAAWSDCRPNFTEEESISRSITIAKAVGCPIYIVHMSTAEGADVVAKAKSEGLNVSAETCPHYLTFTKHDKRIGVLGKVNPSLRDTNSIERLWRGLEDGTIDTIGTDHCVLSQDKKVGKGDIWTAEAGFPGSATMLPVLLSEGVNKRKIPLERIVEISSYNTAKIFGLYPKKGAIAIGSDADFTIVDMDKKVVVKPEILKSSSDFTLYEGLELEGWPVMTIVRGNIVVEDGEIVGKPGTGKYIHRRLQVI